MAASTQDLEKNPKLLYRLHVLLYDLRHFQSDESSRTRLEALYDPTFIGEPYFDDTDAQQLRSLAVADGKDLQTVISDHLSEKLNRREEKREQTGDYRICTAHDIAPLLEDIFEMQPKDLQTNKKFRKQLRKYGLDFPAGQEFRSLSHKRRAASTKQ